MKYYETHYEEYLNSLQTYNMHPELEPIKRAMPASLQDLHNMIIYGSTGSGKYTQTLNLLSQYSPSHLKYDKKMHFQNEKTNYNYRISDIHYEIDLGLLGCNSKMIWHDIFFQIVDIISIKTEKSGIIVCKNFHQIHNELLEIFYSYMQQCKLMKPNINVCIWIITENVSFLPNNILNCCELIRVAKPSNEVYMEMMKARLPTSSYHKKKIGEETPSAWRNFIQKTGTQQISSAENISKIMGEVDSNCILNTKELQSFTLASSPEELPKDVFNTICDNIIKELLSPNKLKFTEFRDTLYDILVYNLEITDCLWYILYYLIENKYLEHVNMRECMEKIHIFLKQYNNNYRPIYHLESIFYYFISEIHKYNPEKLAQHVQSKSSKNSCI